MSNWKIVQDLQNVGLTDVGLMIIFLIVGFLMWKLFKAFGFLGQTFLSLNGVKNDNQNH